jgi:membrane protein DedA with SNARE-associated domain/membrane-associated phospholipid phosphatase
MNELFVPLLTWIGEHPIWAGVAVFFVAFSESVAIFGLLVPGVVMMFGFGALIATGTLNFWPVFCWAVAGALAGDGLSFWLGHHYRERLQGFWPFSRYPSALKRGVVFFERYGGKSVAIGRFFGPVRAIIPLVAGMLGMSPWRFLIANLSSALIWAPAYLLPGIVFGASLELASEVAFRLVLLMLLLLGLAWGAFKLVHTLFRLIQPHATSLLQRCFEWGQLHRGFRSISAALADPNHPEAKVLAFLATLLLLTTLLFALLIGITLDGALTKQTDQLVYNALQSLRTPWGDYLMVLLSSLGDLSTTLIFGGGTIVLLFWQGHKRAANYLLAAVGFGLIAPLLLKVGLHIPRPPASPKMLGPWSFPSAHTLRSVTLFGFYSIMVARLLIRNWRWFPYSIAALIIGAVAFSRLYLGVHWGTDVLASLALGVAWIALLGIAYYRHVIAKTQSTTLIGSGVVLVILCTGYHWVNTEQQIQEYQPHVHLLTASQTAWRAGQVDIPELRQDIRRHDNHPLNLQLVGDPKRLSKQLEEQGWQPAEMLNWGNLMHLLSPSTALIKLPVLPQVHDARHEELVMVKNLSPDKRLILRLWPTSLRIGSQAWPLSVGNISAQQAETLLGLLIIPRTEADFLSPMIDFLKDIRSIKEIVKVQTSDPIMLLIRS